MIDQLYFVIKNYFIYRDTASETVRTLLVYGYNLDPPTGETNEGTLLIDQGAVSQQRPRL